MKTEAKKYMALRQEMERQGLSIRKLALSAGIVPQSLNAALNGNVKFWDGWKRKVSDALGVSVEDLFKEGGEEK